MEAESESRGATTYAALMARGNALLASEPNYARFLLYAARATDPDDLAPYDAATLDAEFRTLLLQRSVIVYDTTMNEGPAEDSEANILERP